MVFCWISSFAAAQTGAATPAEIARAVHRRDRGRCALCGCDADRIQRIVNRLRKQREFGAARIYILALRREGFDTGLFTVGRLWQADHIRPGCEGGVLCGPDGYRTLCIPCHKRATAELARRRRRAS